MPLTATCAEAHVILSLTVERPGIIQHQTPIQIFSKTVFRYLKLFSLQIVNLAIYFRYVGIFYIIAFEKNLY